MTVMVGKLTSIGGEPFGGEGHAVNIFSRVTRTSTEGDAVILQLIDRIDMPGVEDGGDGTFTTADMNPGPIRVELEGSSRHGEGWDINLPDPDPEDPRPWSLGSLIGLQVDWDPVVVGRAEAAAREATRQADAAEGHAGVAAEHREHIDEVVYDVLHNAAGMVRDEVKDDADRAQTQAGIAAGQAGVAAGHAGQAGEDRAQTGADRRQTGEDRAQTGRDAEAAEGWAGQSKDAATLAITSAAALERHVADRDPTDDDTAYKGAIWVAPDQVWIRGEDAWHPISANDVDATSVREALAGKVDKASVPPQGETAWAHATLDGQRLPLGYDHSGHLDEHARQIFREDLDVLDADGVRDLVDGKADQAAVDAALAGKLDADDTDTIRQAAGLAGTTEQAAGTAWAHATSDGVRLPLGYTHDGRLDDHAKRLFREDVTGTFEDESTGEYVHVVTSPEGHLLVGYRRDGTVEIPGMAASSGGAGPANDLYVHQDGTVQPTRADMSQLTVWGSSTPNLTIPFLREALDDLPLTLNGQAKGGERVQHTAARMGVIPALIDPVTIPASGTVDVTSPNLPIYGAMLDFTGTLGGVHGTLGATADTIQFTRTAEGEPVTLTEPTPVIPDVGPTMRDHVSIIGAGKNNILDAGSEQLVIDYNDAMFDYLTPQNPRALIIGMHTNTGERSTARHAWATTINDHFRRRFGSLFIDLRAMVTGPDIWDQTGITPTPEDLEQQAAGNLPPSLSPDTAHLVDVVSVVLAETIRDRMLTLQWY